MPGNGFAALVHSNRPETALAALAGPPWRDLAARVVVMRPDRRLEAPAGIAAVRALDLPDRQLARFAGHVLLLRSDRYVAACFAVGALEAGAQKVQELIGRTFR